MASRPNSGFLDRDLPYLPAEIKSLVADFLIKSDLKNVRLVSRDWSAPATPSLFDRVFVSPYDKDLQIFANITHDPILASSIKELICDTSTIPELSYEEYFYQLRREVSSITWRPEKRFPFRSSSRRINRFVNGITQDESEPGELLSKYGREQLIENGYRFSRELSAEENVNIGGAHCTEPIILLYVQDCVGFQICKRSRWTMTCGTGIACTPPSKCHSDTHLML